MQRPRPAFLATILLLCVAFKLLPYVLHNLGISTHPGVDYYPWNFSPMLPLCLFCAAYFADRRLAIVIPLAAWLIGDLGIWVLTGVREFAFYDGQPVLYATFILVVTLGFLLRPKQSFLRVTAAGLGGGTLFFVVTNFGVWAFGDGARYSHDFGGLVTCYEAALPFYRRTLISMGVFLPILFSRLAIVEPSMAPRATAAPLGAQ